MLVEMAFPFGHENPNAFEFCKGRTGNEISGFQDLNGVEVGLSTTSKDLFAMFDGTIIIETIHPGSLVNLILNLNIKNVSEINKKNFSTEPFVNFF